MTIYSLDILLSQFATSSFCHVKFNLYAMYIMWYAGLDETQAGIKIAGRNTNNLRYADDTTLIAESEEELKNLLMKVKEESGKVGLKLNIQKTNIVVSGPITSWQIKGETMETVAILYFSGLQNHCRWWLQPWNSKAFTPWKESYDQHRQNIKKKKTFLCQQRSVRSRLWFFQWSCMDMGVEL